MVAASNAAPGGWAYRLASDKSEIAAILMNLYTPAGMPSLVFGGDFVGMIDHQNLHRPLHGFQFQTGLTL